MTNGVSPPVPPLVRQIKTLVGKGVGNFYINSPLIKMPDLGADHGLHGINVFMKMENLQPSGSFKDRGISEMILRAMEERKITKLICSSGGNAGHAVANAAFKLNIPVDVYIPVTTKPYMIGKLRSKGANVIVHGADWNAADKLAREAIEQNKDALYIPPYDDPVIWEGHSTIIDEIAEQLYPVVPNKIVVAVGGGGLLTGVQQGVYRRGWIYNTDIIAVETQGTASFAEAVSNFPEMNQNASIDKIDSIATSLGAKQVTSGCLNNYCTLQTRSVVVSDKTAVAACRSFSDEFNMLVEPACGAALSYVYDFDKIKWYRKESLQKIDEASLKKLNTAEAAGKPINMTTVLNAIAGITKPKRGKKTQDEGTQYSETTATGVDSTEYNYSTNSNSNLGATATNAAIDAEVDADTDVDVEVEVDADVDVEVEVDADVATGLDKQIALSEEMLWRTWLPRMTFSNLASDTRSIATHHYALNVTKGDTVVVIVCGGGVVNVDLMNGWCKQFNVESKYTPTNTTN